MSGAWRAALGLAGALLGLGARAEAQLSPGALSRPHQALEGAANCLKCHAPGRGVAPAACLACHGALRARIDAGKGLHARPGHAACERCHIEHHGRDFELVFWGKAGRSAFDHGQTGFALDGRHTGLSCESCHRPGNVRDEAALAAGGASPGRTFLGLSTACRSCHADPHQGQFKDAACSTCHATSGWRPAGGFSHAQTRFPLTGRHVRVACEGCHPPGAKEAPGARRFGPVAFATCASCHRDPHEGRLGGGCAACHTTEGWTRVEQARFDHDRTRFPLRGRHVGLGCERCHGGSRARRLAFSACSDCHADRHAGQLAQRADKGRCESCHDVSGFLPARFSVEDHAATRFPLTGGHLAVACDGCHESVGVDALRAQGLAARGDRSSGATEQLRFRTLRCVGCHADPHRGALDRLAGAAGCEACHGTEAWSAVSFDHARTRFALAGAHAALACGGCHRERATGRLRFEGLPTACAGCHRDPHLGQFARGTDAPACERCHNAGEGTWAASRFDHDRDSTFRLEGAHRAVACAACHRPERREGAFFVRYKLQASTCRDCHPASVPDRGSVAGVGPPDRRRDGRPGMHVAGCDANPRATGSTRVMR
jgi:hypothetical protein